MQKSGPEGKGRIRKIDALMGLVLCPMLALTVAGIETKQPA